MSDTREQVLEHQGRIDARDARIAELEREVMLTRADETSAHSQAERMCNENSVLREHLKRCTEALVRAHYHLGEICADTFDKTILNHVDRGHREIDAALAAVPPEVRGDAK